MTEEPKQFIIADDPPEWEPVYVKGKKSLALIVMKNGRGRILDSIGSSMEAYIEDHSEAIEDGDLMVGAPEGLSVWEGVYRVFQCPEGDYDAELDGDFRYRPRKAEEAFEVAVLKRLYALETKCVDALRTGLHLADRGDIPAVKRTLRNALEEFNRTP